MQSLLHEIGQNTTTLPTIYRDNIGAIYVCANPGFHSPLKQIVIDFHFVLDKVQNGSSRVFNVFSHDPLVDALTKPLSRLLLMIYGARLAFTPYTPS